ncbi:UDP-N-acetylmuramoyl-tripeptide--D-alanyl-D-alanine ligase [Ammoniphilus sp. CFH 90114]|uniref:UDP-N-acetylmuramoyl-tripeptide--D-alanyl-D- alanine ligase n=1 Tax=Ammoniphilus sp. CFH 90114 TaxID=2493665 RepID=UPI0013E956B3|nr:UDP-N-acetylmuramoyl-tripeptide--D-alanyl-D-alanine ligase [Ammoniphilus sp. CFH 90114]
MLTLQEIGQAAEGKWIGLPSLPVHSFHFDTRQVGPGGMYIALTGGNRDGHLFLAEAKSKGAVAALISDETYMDMDSGLVYVLVEDTQLAFGKIAKFYRQRLNLPIIAVTGSNGKTTTKDMIAHILSYKKNIYKTYKNFNNHLGVPLSLLQIQPDHQMAVLEMGMNHAGEIDYLASISKPEVSVIVNVTDAHIEHLGSRENIAKAKGELLPHTSPHGFAILNGDNSYVRDISYLNPGKNYFYSIEQESDIYATSIITTDRGTSYTVHVDGKSQQMEIPMFGTYNVANTLPAIFIAYRYGYSLEEIRDSLSTLAISPMRFELVQEVENALVINDAYNASPTSMMSSIQTFSGILPQYKKVLVLGDMYELGEGSTDYHKEVGSFIKGLRESVDYVVTVGDQARHIGESAQVPTRHFSNKDEVAPFLMTFMDRQHALLFKASRGMMLEEVIQDLMAFK